MHNFLKEWALNYVKSKDVVMRRIVSVRELKDGFEINYKHKLVKFLAVPFVDSFSRIVKKWNKSSHLSIICFNTKENLNLLTDEWAALAEYPLLSIYFVNPFSALDKVWIIFPYTHNNIADPDSLRMGLKTMFEQVTECDKKKIEKACL